MAGNFCLQVSWALFLLLSVYIKTLGGSDSQVGAIMGGFGVSSMVAIPAVALLVDRFGRRPFMLAAGFCTVLGSLVFVLVPYLSAWFLVGRIVQGIGFALYLNSALTLLADLLPPERRAKGVGLFGLSGNLAIAIGPPIAEALVTATGAYRTVFALGAALGIGSSVVAWQITEPRRPAGTGLRPPWRRQDAWELRAPALLGLLQGGGFGVLVTFVPAYAQGGGLAFTPFFLAYTGTVVLTRLVGGRLIDRPDRNRLLVPLFLVGVVAVLILTPAPRVWQLVLAGLFFGFSHGLLYPALSAFVLDLARPEHRGRAIGLFSLAFSIGANFLVIVYGVVADHWGYGWMFAAAAATLALGAGYARWDRALSARPDPRAGLGPRDSGSGLYVASPPAPPDPDGTFKT